jgi:hypothetical protein
VRRVNDYYSDPPPSLIRHVDWLQDPQGGRKEHLMGREPIYVLIVNGVPVGASDDKELLKARERAERVCLSVTEEYDGIGIWEGVPFVSQKDHRKVKSKNG